MTVPRACPADEAPLWVITSYFNPAGYRRRLRNYRHFRQRLSAPLLTVEMSTNGMFALEPTDAERLIQCVDGDVMWQKERLLNHARAYLPPACRYVAWVDCDVLFDSDTWVTDVMAALDRGPLVQPFETVTHAPDRTERVPIRPEPEWMTQPSVGAALTDREALAANLLGMLGRTEGTIAPGMAWAARRELFDTHGLFDRAIIGGGDTAFVCAALGVPDVAVDLHQMNVPQRDIYRTWAARLFEQVRGDIQYVRGTAIHLWHGDLRDRHARARHLDLAPYGFDPARDIAIGAHGAWRWASDKPDLHAYLRRYFGSRHEDGPVAQTA